ncbi:MAG: DUF2249 domain-containing protein [Alphaproteobacteria bacterium]|nr:DUF2249 domain-containing protein [Alphaproteobacteria bacterium]
MSELPADSEDHIITCLRTLNDLLIEAVHALRELGRADLASRIAADAWTAVKMHEAPNAEPGRVERARRQESKRLDRTLTKLSQRPERAPSTPSPPRVVALEATPPQQRYATLLKSLALLKNGDRLIVTSERDSKIFERQLEAEYGCRFRWHHLQSGPLIWRASVSRTEH